MRAMLIEPPRVSVLVPSFNHAPYIQICLDSLLRDGYSNLELILLDDGSTDGTYEIAQRWAADNGSRLAGGAHLSQQANCGLVPTLNRLLRSSHNEYFTLLASDDYLLPGGIAARVHHLGYRPDDLAVFADAIGVTEDGEPLAESMLDHGRAYRTALRCDRTRGLEIIARWVMPGPVFLARRSVTDRIGYYDERFGFEDRDYYLRLIAADALGYVDRPVAAYRVPRVRDPERYARFRRDRHRIEQRLVPSFKGIERLALMAVILRNQRPRKHPNPLKRAWYAAPGWMLRRLRQLNRFTARLLLGEKA